MQNRLRKVKKWAYKCFASILKLVLWSLSMCSHVFQAVFKAQDKRDVAINMLLCIYIYVYNYVLYFVEWWEMINLFVSFPQVGVSIKMSTFNLTRIVTLTPFYTIENKSSLELEVGEIASDGSLPTSKWNYIASSEVIIFLWYNWLLKCTSKYRHVNKNYISLCHNHFATIFVC